MNRKVATVDATFELTVLDIVKEMLRSKTDTMIILQGGIPTGIITERDVLKKVSAVNKKPIDVLAISIMSSPLITVKSYDSVDTAASAMTANRVKRLLVLETDGSVVGLISATDIARRLAKILADDYDRYRSLKDALEL